MHTHYFRAILGTGIALVLVAGKARAADTNHSAADRSTRSIALIATTLGAGIAPAEASTIENVVLAALVETHRFTVVGHRDIDALLTLEAKKQLAGCNSDSTCTAQIAAALGVQLVAVLDVGRLGAVTVVSLNVIEVKSANVVARAQQQVRSEDALADAGKTLATQVAQAIWPNEPAPSPALRNLAQARFPKIMFLVQEEYVDKAGVRTTVDQPTLQPLLEDSLLQRGFDIVARDQIEKIRKDERKVLALLNDDHVAASLGMEYGAEYFVRVTAQVRYLSFNDLGLGEYHGFTEITMSAINASTALLSASHKESGPTPANCYSEQEMRINALTALAPKVLDNLLPGLLRSWAQDSDRGARYTVRLMGFKSLRKEGLSFIDAVKGIPGVKDVKQISSEGSLLDLEVFFPSALDAAQVQAAIMHAVSGNKQFDSLDVEYARGRELSFKM